jgi:hypothetical protein
VRRLAATTGTRLREFKEKPPAIHSGHEQLRLKRNVLFAHAQVYNRLLLKGEQLSLPDPGSQRAERTERTEIPMVALSERSHAGHTEIRSA